MRFSPLSCVIISTWILEQLSATMYNRTLAYEVCKAHVDDTSIKMYTNDIKRQGKFAIFFEALPAKRYASEWRVRNYRSSDDRIYCRTLHKKNAERPLEKQ